MKLTTFLSRRNLLLLIAVFLFFIVTIQASFEFGRLSSPPSYDDIWYLLDGAQRYEKLVNWGIIPFLKQLFVIPMHSPFCSLQALLGFLLFGLHDWAPYFLNFFILATFIFYCVRLIGKTDNLLLGSVLLFLFSLPITSWSVHEFRPDFPCALLLSIAASEILIPLSRNILRKTNIVIGILLFMCCLWIKPSFFPHTYILCIATLFIALVQISLSGLNFSDKKNRLLEALGYAIPIILMGTILFSISAGKEAIPYFFHNTNTDFAQQTWIQFSFTESLIRNSIGTSSYLIMSVGNILILSICLIAVIVKFIKKEFFSYPTTAFALALLSLLIVSKSGHDSHYFLMTFWTISIFIFSHLIGNIKIRNLGNKLLPTLLLLSSLFIFSFRSFYCNHNPKQYDWSSLIVEKAYQYGLKSGNKVELFIPLIGTYNDYLLNWRSLLMRKPIICYSNIGISNLEEFKQEIKKYNAILIPGPDNDSIVDYHIISKLRREVETEINNNPEWKYLFSTGTNRQDEWIFYTRNK